MKIITIGTDKGDYVIPIKSILYIRTIPINKHDNEVEIHFIEGSIEQLIVYGYLFVCLHRNEISCTERQYIIKQIEDIFLEKTGKTPETMLVQFSHTEDIDHNISYTLTITEGMKSIYDLLNASKQNTKVYSNSVGVA